MYSKYKRNVQVPIGDVFNINLKIMCLNILLKNLNRQDYTQVADFSKIFNNVISVNRLKGVVDIIPYMNLMSLIKWWGVLSGKKLKG